MKNGKPSNLFPLLKAVKHPLGANQRAFERHFCQGHLRSFGGVSTWVATGQANLKQLHRMIEPKLLHMTKDEYLNELPPMSQETRSVPVSPSFQKQYMEKIKILANLKEAMKTNKTLSSDTLLGAMTDVRIVCALAKVSATVEIAKTVLETEPSIVIFATYQKCVQQMAKHLTDCGHPVAAITGQTNPKERQVLVDGFQVSQSENDTNNGFLVSLFCGLAQLGCVVCVCHVLRRNCIPYSLPPLELVGWGLR
jgi:SNF2 family DNA or RNA helicase